MFLEDLRGILCGLIPQIKHDFNCLLQPNIKPHKSVMVPYNKESFCAHGTKESCLMRTKAKNLFPDLQRQFK